MTGAEEQADWLVNEYLGQRLEDANEPPGLRAAVSARIAQRVDDLRQRLREQSRYLRSPSSRRIPDAYLADEEALEDELQIGASGIRSAMALEGILTEPRTFELDLARDLAPNPQWSVLTEASRVPRPSTRAPELSWSLDPLPWLEEGSIWPPSGSGNFDADSREKRTGAEPVRVREAPYSGWIQLGMFELQATLASRYPAVPARQVIIITGLEACDGEPPRASLPLSEAPPNVWAEGYADLVPGIDATRARTALRTTQGPLISIVDFESQPGAPSPRRGPGLPITALAPRIEVPALLGLRPEQPALRHVLVDDNGPALVGRLWRGFLIHDGTYTPLEPGVVGADVILRPDLYELLEAAVGKGRLSLGLVVSQSEREPAATDDE